MKSRAEIKEELDRVVNSATINEPQAFRCSIFMSHALLWCMGLQNNSPSDIVKNQKAVQNND